FWVSSNSSLVDIAMSALTTVGGNFGVSSNNSLVDITMGALTTVAGGAFNVSSNGGGLSCTEIVAFKDQVMPTGAVSLASDTETCS
ncbi:MAG: hypothetical protein GY822_05860, partial [Deltaproteobacteria bacterium]|nr:hypothetical protein [Deltaproteobacteria bacterium]